MAILRHLITNWIAGEISPMLFGRVDTQQYAAGLETCENFVPVNEGPLVKRPGFEFIRAADASASWLSAFRFSVSQEYVLEWGENKLRFYTNGGRIETAPNVAYECAVPYAASEASAVSTQQSYDRLYMDHAAHPPGRLNRTGAVTFSYDVSALKFGPFADQNTDETITVEASATTGSGITLTASSAIFRAGHVGAFFRIEALDFSDVKVWEAQMKNIDTGTYRRSSVSRVYQAAIGGTTGSREPVHDSGKEWDGSLNPGWNDDGPYGVLWEYIHDRFGIVKITAVAGDGLSCTADVVRRLPNSLSTVPSWRWAHALFSNDAGFPSLVVHAFGRQIHIKDFDLAASVAGDFLNHQTFTSAGTVAADVAFRRRLAVEDPPLWVLPDRQLIAAGTAAKELSIGAINAQAAVSSDNIKAEPQTYYGSEKVWPIQHGSETVFVERGGRRLRSMNFDFSQDRYAAVDLTAAARHVTASGIRQLAFQRWPFLMAHAVRDDGQIVVHPLSRADVKGFARTVLGGGARAVSGVAVVGEDGRTDDLWLLVERETPAGTAREIWKQSTWRELGDDQREAFFVDGGARASATAGQTHFSGLTHLAGQAVAVLAGGGVIPNMRVADDGTLDLPASAVPQAPYTLVVGLAYTATAVLLRPAPQNASGALQGLVQRVVSAVIRVLETVGLKVGGNVGEAFDLIDRPSNAAMDAPIPLFTGDRIAEVECDFDDKGQLRFVSADPVPAIVAMASLKIMQGNK